MRPKTGEILISKDNLYSLVPLIDSLSQKGIRRIKLVLPFKIKKSDIAPPLSRVVWEIEQAKKYAEAKRIEIFSGYHPANNPYLPKDAGFFDTDQAKLKIDFRRFKNRPKITVVIPSYNKKDSLRFALKNFFNQSIPKSEYEVIVVDDGSKDGTGRMMEKLKPACNFKYIYWPRKEIKLKQGYRKWSKFYNRVGPVRNIGIEHAQGEIILFNDADVLVDRSCLAKHKQYHDQRDNLVIRGFRNYLPDSFKPSYKNIDNFRYLEKIAIPERERWEKPEGFRDENYLIDKWFRFVTANLSIRKKYLEEIGGFDKDFVFWGFEDTDLGYRLSRKFNLIFIWDDKIKVYHLYHSREAGDKLNDLFAFKIGLDILYNKYLDKEIYDIYKEVIMGRLEDLILEDCF